MKRYKITENNITYDIEERDNGDKFWYLKGKFNRENGPAVEWCNGTIEWYKDGKRHRDNGPAYEDFDGYKSWHKNGNIHRTDGPAVEWTDGSKQYWYNGEYLEHINSDKDLKRYIKLLSIS